MKNESIYPWESKTQTNQPNGYPCISTDYDHFNNLLMKNSTMFCIVLVTFHIFVTLNSRDY